VDLFLLRAEILNRHQRLDGRQHGLLISAVIADIWNFQILAITKITAPALATAVVLTTMPADSHTLPSPWVLGNPQVLTDERE
jgi:hypothetical protein